MSRSPSRRRGLPQRVEVTAESTSRRGDGVGTVDGYDVAVPGLLVGERAEVQIEHVARRHRQAHARLVALREASPHRHAPPCRHQNRCSGCPLMHATVAGQVELKHAWLRSLGIEVDELRQGPDAFGYRWSAKRVVGGRAGELRLGSFVRGSHELADMRDCMVDHPDIVAAAAEIGDVANELAIVPYDEASGAGDLRYVWLKTNGRGDVLVTLVSASHESRVAELANRLERAAGVAWSVQPSKGNALRGSEVKMLRGRDHIEVELLGTTTRIGPLGFLQPNPVVASMAYVDLVEGGGSPSGGLAYDLYAGAGVTTALLAKRHEQVVPCEASPESAAALGIAAQTAEAFLAEPSRAAETPTLIVANPPRAGLGTEVCAALIDVAKRCIAAGQAHHLHVMSCDPEALARDIERLTADGSYRLVGARGYDTLVHTPHVEVVAWLEAGG
jgi:23S rRNA (uracil1939-C5)-methyltransferase